MIHGLVDESICTHAHIHTRTRLLSPGLLREGERTEGDQTTIGGGRGAETSAASPFAEGAFDSILVGGRFVILACLLRAVRVELRTCSWQMD